MSNFRPFMQAVVSFVVLSVSIYVLLSPQAPPDSKAWSQNAIAMLMGFWLRGK